MPTNPSSPQPIAPLSVGNVVSAGLRLYRDHFKSYFKLAFIAYLWILVPLYGWAKFSAISGLISRLAYSELIERPETISEARRHVNPNMWNFLLAGFLVGLILSAVVLGIGIIFIILAVIFGIIVGDNAGGVIFGVLLGIIAFIVAFIAYIRILSHLFIVEVPLAIESNVDASSAISRSWQLTKGYIGRLQWIVVVAFLVSLPITITVQIISSLLEYALGLIFPADSPIYSFLYVVIVIALSFASGSLLIPFWQAIKAVIYFDLRNRKEGMDLRITDR